MHDTCLVRLLYRFERFLPQSENKHVRLIGDSKLSVGVNKSVNGCLSAMNW